MFEKLVELLINGWEQVRFCFFVHPYQHGVVLRFGAYVRTRGPGLNWKWPLIEEVVEVTTCLTTLRLAPQTLTTADDVQVVCAAIVKYAIRDPQPYVCDIWDQTDVLADVCMGEIRKATRSANYKTLIESPPEATILAEIRKQVNKFGFKIETVTFTDLARVKSLRLITPHAPQLAN